MEDRIAAEIVRAMMVHQVLVKNKQTNLASSTCQAIYGSGVLFQNIWVPYEGSHSWGRTTESNCDFLPTGG